MKLDSTPILNFEIKDEVVYSPIDYLNYKQNIEGHKIPNIPEKCILCFEPSFVEYAKNNLNIKKIDWFRKDFIIHNLVDFNILLVNVNYGAALSAIALEELIALGVKNFIVVGSAGTLQENILLGSFVIAESAIREEGVSYHYSKPGKYAYCSSKLLSKAKELITEKNNIFIGTTWSTDSFYRETITKVKKYKAEGVLSVDMEASALYTVADYRKVDILSMFYISDSIANLKWNPEFHKTNSEETQKLMINFAVSILS